MKIGIFGGCFNPPHNMHKAIAKSLIDKGYLDKVVFVPTGDNYEKSDLVSIDRRIDMLSLMLDNEKLSVSDISKDLNYQYTFQVLDYYQVKHPNSNIYFICGTDNLKEFETWKRYEYILNNYQLLVVIRNGDDINHILEKYPEYSDNINIANIDQNPISSTIIRMCIKEDKFESLAKYIDYNVLKYIQNKGLYKK